MTSTHQRGDLAARIPVVAGAIVAVLLVMAIRVAQLTIVDGKDLGLRGRRQHNETVRIAGLRGSIRDRSGELLAETVVAPSIFANPRKFPVASQIRPALAQALGVPLHVLNRRLDDTKRGFVWLKRRATHDQAREIARLAIPGLGSIGEGRRLYPQGAIGAHVLGTAGDDQHGLEGVELLYDRWMSAPETVLSFERDGLGRSLMTAGLDNDLSVDADETLAPPPPATLAAGASLTLTLEADLQGIVERELAEGVIQAQADAGTAVMLDPKTGAVLALANYPTYDPNNPGDAVPGARRDRAVTDSFEPGSTFKAILTSAALEEHAIRPTDSVFCENGSYHVGKWTIHDHKPYGLLSIPEVIQYSSNIGASKIAERLGRERFARYLGAFGFGHRTAIDLPGEVAGQIRPVQRWAQIDLATGSFGQGLSVTPIQLAAAYAAIADGGRLRQPHLLRRAVDPNGRVLLDRDDPDDEAASRQVISPDTARTVAEMLERVVEVDGGTGSKARIAGVRVAGKTGTAQKVDPHTGRYSKARLASFIGFAPVEDPAFVLLVMIDTPRAGETYGGLVAAPVFREIMSRALDRLGGRRPLPLPVKPLPAKPLAPRGPGMPLQQASLTVGTEQSVDATVRSFLGMSLRRALSVAAADGLAVDVRGSGFVTQQNPAPGTPRSAGDEVVLYLEPST